MRTYQTAGWTALGDPDPAGDLRAAGRAPARRRRTRRELPVSRPAVSQHLKVLKDARLVVDQRDGTRRIYRLDPDGLRALRGYLDHFWDQALAAYKTAVEQHVKESS